MTSRNELLHLCRASLTSFTKSRDLLSRPEFFDFVARVVRTVWDNRADSELTGALKLLLRTLSVIIAQSPLAPRERELKRSALALLEVLLEGAKRGFITNEVVNVMGDMAVWLNLIEDRRLTIKLCHLLLELHAIKSIRTLRDEPGRPRIELSTGSTDVLVSFLVMCKMTFALSKEDPECAIKEGLAPTPALLGSVLRHMARLAKESRDGRWSKTHDALMVPLGQFVTHFGLWIWPSGRLASALEQLPADSRADLALALGLYLAGETEASQLSLVALSPVMQLLTSSTWVLWPHMSSFVGAPGCFPKLVDLAESPMGAQFVLTVLCTALELDPDSVKLLKTPDFARLVHLAFRLDTIKVLDGEQLSDLITMSAKASITDAGNLALNLATDIVLSKASSCLPACLPIAPLIPVPMPDRACSGGRGRTSSWFSSRLPWMTLGLPIASGCCSSCSRWTSIGWCVRFEVRTASLGQAMYTGPGFKTSRAPSLALYRAGLGPMGAPGCPLGGGGGTGLGHQAQRGPEGAVHGHALPSAQCCQAGNGPGPRPGRALGHRGPQGLGHPGNSARWSKHWRAQGQRLDRPLRRLRRPAQPRQQAQAVRRLQGGGVLQQGVPGQALEGGRAQERVQQGLHRLRSA